MAMKYADAGSAFPFLSVLFVVEQEQAVKAGLSVGGLRALVRVAALADVGVRPTIRFLLTRLCLFSRI